MVANSHPRFRYVVFRISSEVSIRESFVAEAMGKVLDTNRRSLVHYDGVFGIVRCTNLSKDITISSLNAVKSIGGKKVQIKTVGTSGTIKKAKAKFIR